MNTTIQVRRVNIHIDLIEYIVLLFPILGENIVSSVLGSQASRVMSVLSCVVILIICVVHKIRISKFNACLLLLIVHHIIITLAATLLGTAITATNNIITPYGLVGYFMLFLLIDAFISNSNKAVIMFKSIELIMMISVFLNFFFTADMQIANNGSILLEALNTGYTNSRQWLFGHRNMIFIHHLMWILFSYIVCKIENRNYTKLFIFQIAFTMIVGIVSWNSTMMLGTFVIAVLGMFRKKLFSGITMMHYAFAYALLEIGIVFFRLQDKFSYLIINILHRNLSFTGRTRIWDYYIKQFTNGDVLYKLFGNLGETALTNNSHNMLLGLLVFTGMIGLVLYLFLFYMATTRLIKESPSDMAAFVSIIIFGFLINSLAMEFYLQPMLAMFIGYDIKEIAGLSISSNRNVK